MKRLSARPVSPVIWAEPLGAERHRSLGREAIVQAAMEVADEGGAAGLTMAAVAKRLGTYTPMALYRYVLHKDGLIDLMLDAATAEVSLPVLPGADWKSDLRSVAVESWAMVKRHLWYAHLVPTRPPLGPHMLRRTDFMLQVLVGGGATLVEAMTYAAVLDRHIFGTTLQDAEEQAMQRRSGLQTSAELAAAITTVREAVMADDRYPMLSEWMSQPTGPTPDEQFELSLEFLISGMASRLDGRNPPTGTPPA